METPVSQVQNQRYSNSKSVTELVKEITMLEMEVFQLEKYIVSLYQKALDRRLASLSKDGNDTHLSELKDDSNRFQTLPVHAINKICSEEYSYEAKEQDDMLGCSIHRTHSSLSHHSTFSTQFSPSVGKVAAEAVNSYHSLPLTLLQPDEALNDSNEVKETANWLSEEMVRCISSIYCELGGKSVISNNNFTSPAYAFSFPSSLSGSPRAELNLWSPQSRIHSSQQDLQYSEANYHVGGQYEFIGPYCEMVEIFQICKESSKLRDVDPLLQKFRSLVNRLENINPAKLSRKEKLAFWINVHNALVMHAFLVHGVPQNKLKRVSLLLKERMERR